MGCVVYASHSYEAHTSLYYLSAKMQISSNFQLMEIWRKGTHCADMNYLRSAFLRGCHCKRGFN